MKKKHNAAIVILAARIPLLTKVLEKFHINWNNKFKYPIYIHTFGDLINQNLKNEIKSKFSSKIEFCIVNPSIPNHIPEEDLYYNRKYLNYVSKAFPKKRIGYLHMCYFKSNITSFENGCLNKKLSKYDKIMFYDDDNDLKKNIKYDFFDIAEDYPITTGFVVKRKMDREYQDITENLWNFYFNYIKQNNLTPLDLNLKNSIINNDEKIIYDLEYSCGTLEIYNLNYFKNINWEKYIKEVNKFGGNYKYRWGDMQISNLFVRTFFKNPIFNLNLLQNEILKQKIKGSDEFVYYKSLDQYNSKIFKLLIKIKKFISSLKI